jgi:hypothetical protein
MNAFTTTKTKFNLKDSVRTVVNTGIVSDVAPFADHTEYLVEWTDKTATWIHEQHLSATTRSGKKS